LFITVNQHQATLIDIDCTNAKNPAPKKLVLKKMKNHTVYTFFEKHGSQMLTELPNQTPVQARHFFCSFIAASWHWFT